MESWHGDAQSACTHGAQQNLKGEAAEAFIKKITESCSFIKITPDTITLKEYLPDFSMRSYEWKKD